jgi:hypothetical protein
VGEIDLLTICLHSALQQRTLRLPQPLGLCCLPLLASRSVKLFHSVASTDFTPLLPLPIAVSKADSVT